MAEDKKIASPEEITIKYKSYFFFLIIDTTESTTTIMVEIIGSAILVKKIDTSLKRVLLPTKSNLPIFESIFSRIGELINTSIEIIRKKTARIINVIKIFFTKI